MANRDFKGLVQAGSTATVGFGVAEGSYLLLD